MDTQHTPSPASAGAVSAETQREKAWREAGERIQREDMGLDKLAPPAPTPAVPVEAKQEPIAIRWERRQGWGDGRGGLVWQKWEPCTEADARRVTGLRTWEVRRLECFATPTAGTPAPAVPCPRGHNWHDYGQLGGRNVSWCPRCDTLAFTGSEPDHAAAPAAPAVQGLTLERIDEIADSDECNPDDRGWGPKFSYRAFARAIEREVRSTSPSVTHSGRIES